MADTKCVFCAVVDGRIPSVKLCEDDKTFVVMDINPLTRGHCLVIVKTHVPTIFDADVEDLAAAISMVQRVALAARQAMGAEGMNIHQANGVSALQSVRHLHFHVVPRFEQDGAALEWKLVPGDPHEIRQNGERIREVLSAR